MKAACIGDNCVDYYRNLDRGYPTGNAVDTAVNMQHLGVPSAIISTTGSDEYGAWMIESLRREGLDTSHLKVAKGRLETSIHPVPKVRVLRQCFLVGTLRTLEGPRQH